MKKLFLLLLLTIFSTIIIHAQFKIREKIKSVKEGKNTVEAAKRDIEKIEKKTPEENSGTGDANNQSNDPGKTRPDTPAPVSTSPDEFKSYQNYDFVPGDKVIFEDNFEGEQDGEFPSHWELLSGQAILNKLNGKPALLITDGNYGKVKPRMKSNTYLADPYTIEFDYFHTHGAYPVVLIMSFYDKTGGYNREASITIGPHEIDFTAVNGYSLLKQLPGDISDANNNEFTGKWHHIAIINKNRQLKVYVDQYRTLVVPDTKEDYENITFASIGAEKSPPAFTNLRIASGGNMNLIGKKFTDTKIITHGINFDVNKATIKPESMGTLNMIVQVMKDNPAIKFEIGGHTDNSGTAANNLLLSQQRASAVKDALIKLGVDASRLTTKGFGDTKPLNENNTLEGKANNRRVEFEKM